MPSESQEPPKGFAGSSNRALIKGLKRRIDSPAGVARAFRLTRAEERRLLAGARAGDRRALRRLFEMLSGPVYRFGRGFCGNPDDAEDVAQVVLSALARTLRDFRGDSSLTTWAYTVARHACSRQRRRGAHEPKRIESLEAGGPGGAAFGIPDETGDPQRALERHELRRALDRAIAALPPSQREVFVLRDVEGLPAREVGRILGLGERAVKSRLHRARLTLRESLSPYVDGEPERGRSARATRRAGSSRCPDTSRLLSRYLEGELDDSVCERLEGHVRACPDCTATCEALRGALLECRRWRGEALPAEVKRRIRTALREASQSRRKP